MKILFVCWANVGRSQMARGFYNHLTKTSNADSSGTEVETPGETLEERKIRRGGTFTIEAMLEQGINIKDYKRTQVTQEELANYDKVISMAQPEHTPTWLSDAPNFIYWDIEDPGGKGLAETIEARDKIEAKVVELINDISADS
jgi:protein-tyrosine-phosphatase